MIHKPGRNAWKASVTITEDVSESGEEAAKITPVNENRSPLNTSRLSRQKRMSRSESEEGDRTAQCSDDWCVLSECV